MAWIEYNPNPRGNRVGDCAIRAIAKATDQEAVKILHPRMYTTFIDKVQDL